MKKISGPKVLLLDIETLPIQADVWSIWNVNVGLNQINQDWTIGAWCAKWLDEDKIYYADQRNARNIRNDKQLLKPIWKLLDQADVVITQNGKAFDEKKLKTRFIINGFKPYSSFKHIDTKQMAKKFGFTSNRLEYLLKILNCKVQKSKHKEFPGHELWTECLKRNPKAWKEMKHYNILDVLGLEELYKKLQPWGGSYDPGIYTQPSVKMCACGSTKFRKNGYFYGATGRYQRFKCASCGAESRARRQSNETA